MTEVTNNITDFDYINLNEVDPGSAKMPDGDYTFEVSSAELKSYTRKKDNTEAKYTNFQFTIVDDANYSGRRLYHAVFPDTNPEKPYAAKQLRRLMDATGVQQTGLFEDWLKDLQGARFSAQVKTINKAKQGEPENLKQEVILFSVKPA